MAHPRLEGRRIAILATDGVEQSELTGPREALDQAGATTTLVAPKGGTIRAFQHDKKGQEFSVDLTLAEARVDDFDALLLPGGVMNPDQLRQDPQAVRFVKAFAAAGKPIGAICHAPWLLIEADIVRGRTITSFPSLKTDVRNAGATWVDREVVVDQGLVTSRKPEDIPAFSAKLIEEISEGVHAHAGAGAGSSRQVHAGATSGAASKSSGNTGSGSGKSSAASKTDYGSSNNFGSNR
jgi:protease I